MFRINETTSIEDMTVAQPLGPGLSANFIEMHGIEKMEIWGTSFKDEGPDFTEFRLFNRNNKLVSTIRVSGF